MKATVRIALVLLALMTVSACVIGEDGGYGRGGYGGGGYGGGGYGGGGYGGGGYGGGDHDRGGFEHYH